MSKKNVLKLTLDLCMVVTLVLMYRKMAINMTFHELGGLILIGVMLIHVLINWKWVAVITKKLFNKSVPKKTKLGYIINALLLIVFLLIGISGIMISKVLFHISVNGGMSWKTIHYTASAFALILIGIHLGLHKQFICSNIKKIILLPQKLRKIVGIALTIILVAFGGYSMVTTSFTSWLFMPFTMQQMSGGFEGGERPDRGDISQEETTSEASEENSEASSVSEGDNTVASEAGTDGTETSSSSGEISRPENGSGASEKPEGMGQSSGIGTALNTIIEFFSITFVFATITALIEMLITSRKRRQSKN